jgi:hypothetical protein
MNKRKNYIIHDPTFCTEEKRLLLINAVRWFLDRYKMQLTEFKGDFEKVNIRVNAWQYKDLKCYGQCYEWEGEKIDYVIDIAIDQSIRDTLATIFHECVHLWQWERGDWKGEGEREAASLQYELADEYWKSGNV